MAGHLFRSALLAVTISVTVSSAATAQRAGVTAEVLTNQDVMSMVAGRINRDLLVAKINATRNSFDVTVNGVISLHMAKVHADIIRTMILVAADPKLGDAGRKTADVLDNQAVIAMVGSKVPRPVILAKIQHTKAAFDVSAAGLVALTQAKVPADVIKAMVTKTGL